MAIIKQYHKDTDTTYVYESISYWDAEKGQSRSKRKCIGKIDPETGEIIPTGKRGRKKKEAAASGTDKKEESFKDLYEQAKKEGILLQERVRTLEQQCEELTRKNQVLSETLDRIHTLSSNRKG